MLQIRQGKKKNKVKIQENNASPTPEQNRKTNQKNNNQVAI
jgi:hypothetical protein